MSSITNMMQVLLKLEKLYKELTERYGGEPSFMQWAAAAGVDQMTLRRRINHGTFCKDKMIKSNVRLVISIAKNYQGAGMNLQDLVQVPNRELYEITGLYFFLQIVDLLPFFLLEEETRKSDFCLF